VTIRLGRYKYKRLDTTETEHLEQPATLEPLEGGAKFASDGV